MKGRDRLPVRIVSYLTVPEMGRRFDLPYHQAHRLADWASHRLERFGNSRIIPEEILPELRAEAARRGWIQPEAVSHG